MSNAPFVTCTLDLSNCTDAKLDELAKAIEEERVARGESRRANRRAKALLQKYRIRR